jgi:hypothetical protein
VWSCSSPTRCALLMLQVAIVPVVVLIRHLCINAYPANCRLQPASLDTAFQRRIRFELQFAMPPPSLRTKLWRLMLPKQVWLVMISLHTGCIASRCEMCTRCASTCTVAYIVP